MYLVTGATGSVGKRIVRRLRDRDLPVRAFVRLSSNYAELEQRGAEIFIGDLAQERDIRKACRDVRYIISAHGSDSGQAQAIDYRANVDLMDFGQENRIDHFVYVSVLGTDRGYQDSPVFKAKREVENTLQKRDVNYTILRPSGFASNLLPLAERFRDTGIYFAIGDLKNRSSILSPDDLAEIAIQSPQHEAARNQIFAVGGPEILTREDIPKIFGQVFQKDPFVVNLPLTVLDGVRSAVGFLNPELQRSLGTLRILLANEFFCTSEEIHRLESVFDIQMESLESFLRRYLLNR
ncbi:SDR family oxidoreductase [Sodalinema gerasimenkoae]|uniref:SDR family oxidoreductase n=1 Tax=Sodalinema gerasimenkoae TaxID=2862348 RepID=UPI001356E357|nr:SDR family oxidoreductase [Sodalinema gerasimenkoae]